MRVQQAMEKQLEETNARWDEERQAMSHSADQANKVSDTTHFFTPIIIIDFYLNSYL